MVYNPSPWSRIERFPGEEVLFGEHHRARRWLRDRRPRGTEKSIPVCGARGSPLMMRLSPKPVPRNPFQGRPEGTAPEARRRRRLPQPVQDRLFPGHALQRGLIELGERARNGKSLDGIAAPRTRSGPGDAGGRRSSCLDDDSSGPGGCSRSTPIQANRAAPRVRAQRVSRLPTRRRRLAGPLPWSRRAVTPPCFTCSGVRRSVKRRVLRRRRGTPGEIDSRA